MNAVLHMLLVGFLSGGFRKEILTKELVSEIKMLQPEVEDLLRLEGNYVLFPLESVEEVWSQVVNGKNYVTMINNGEKYFCIRYYKDLKGNIEVKSANTCTSLNEYLYN